MPTLSRALAQLSVSATIDDVSVPIVQGAARRLSTPPPGSDEIERVLNFVAHMLRRGFIAVDNPYAGGTPWPEQGKAALCRLHREWEALEGREPTFLDLCWFRLPQG